MTENIEDNFIIPYLEITKTVGDELFDDERVTYTLKLKDITINDALKVCKKIGLIKPLLPH